MLKNTVLLFITWFLTSNLFSQATSYNFYMIDKNTMQGIPFVSVYSSISKKAFQSNDQGFVSIHESNIENPYTTYHIGYESEGLDLKTKNDSVFLIAKSYALPVVELKQISAMEVIKKAINRVEKNYYSSQHFMEGRYFQLHKENQRYVRYIEAQASIEKMGYAPKIQLPQEDKFAILGLRKSYNYEKNGDQHGDHLVDLFAENPIQYMEKSVLNLHNIDLYQWQFSHINAVVYSITFQNNTWGSQRNIIGELMINREDFAVLSINIIELPNEQAQINHESNWEFVNGWFVIDFEKFDGKYQVTKSKKWYHHSVRNINNHKEIQFEVEEQFIWETTLPVAEKQDLKYTKLSNLYSLQLKYDSLQWQQNTYLETVSSDLELSHSIYYQFANP